MKKIAFIGVGVMGKFMVSNLLKNGFEVSIYARNKAKVEDSIKEGAVFCETIKECVQNKDAIITIVGYPKDVEEVYLSQEGIINSASQNSYLIDMTTTTPTLSVKIHEEAKKKNLKALDAPVSGGDIGAKNATLSIMVGGEKEDFEACKKLFEAMGKTIVYAGNAGSGQHTKMANQIAIAGVMAGVSEAIAYGKKMGLDIPTMLASISNGAAQSFHLTNNAPKMYKREFEPGFYIKHMVKDLKIANEEMPNLKVLKDVLEIYETLEKNGDGDLGTQAICKYYE
ncbi:3-hydroxyisobutyrate dehydrogenase family protein [Aliarcobacter butzleri 7h1h]|uniref:NAD(P)-dependent oxidoreductase n=1 Tax=Aliarcobacter butzleri TaxID=28197 RepID=UPI00030AFF97|nr:NAD(P)-dependent oxidoreductase [Aliarcobacter butzleri]AGR77703.1 3-hydroxyisobutyrate dehydrogenase family protein [Aliarcobacter butzleri 7h1h]MCG3684736.1 NAD(P)-dependent oxidoreductase [Aliarcobacter butzleri]MDN5060631.1 NAD(P)-dependent oxidoreductase [Aliarcobacter butzleri]MDN5093439.1 NAD(P)-dependent oxidoreductase [Aliarcobacter butzleri]PZQ08152.1 MAG: NAD(P)-dependent oxidoreductase [Aliarcobacter butzleri]